MMTRDQRLPVLLTASERRRLEAAAKAAGMPVSTWMRYAALKEAAAIARRVVADASRGQDD